VSRVERRLPPPPRIGRSVREAALDLYYNSWRFLPGNMSFGIVLIALLAAVATTPWGWVVAIGLIPPAAGCMRMATTLIRDGHTDFGEFLAVLRRPWQPLAVGCAQLALVLVLAVDLQVGRLWESPIGGVLAVSALYGLTIGWAYTVVAWPIILDPLRASEPLRARLRLAGLLILAHPLRMGGLALLVGVFLAAATVAIAAIVTVALAFAFLVVARYVLPAADRLEGRETVEVELDA
jgi:hypothetical protein